MVDYSLLNCSLLHYSLIAMRLEFTGERVLAIVAHPDDAELLCAGTLARAKADGAEAGICVLCQGNGGQPAQPIDDLAGVRRAEMQAASRVLGSELFCEMTPDSRLADDEDARSRLVDVLRRFHPTLLLAHSANDYHADHRAASQLAEACSWLCASRGYESAHDPLPSAPALWWMDTVGMQGFEPGIFIDISTYVDLKEQMLACHRSQLQRAADTDFAPLQELMQHQMTTRGRQAGVATAEAFRPHHAFKRTRAW